MQIDSHDISFRTTHSRHEKHTRRETFTFATRHRRSRIQTTTDGDGNTEVNSRTRHVRPDRVEISEQGKKASESGSEREDDPFELTSKQKMELQLIRMMFDQLLEGNFEDLDPETFLEKIERAAEGEEESEDETKPEEADTGESDGQPGSNRDNGADFGFSYEYHERHVESEKLTFAAEGRIKTADGREINFSTDLNISRSFFRETSVNIQGGNAKLVDPLVVNYGGKAAELSQRHFSFDLNADGVDEEIASLEPGSGFLARDVNRNGRIDDGSELFGPETGHGFRELAEHDADKNRFIDGGDPIYDQLMLMTSSLSGERTLISLEEAGVGAIFLGSTDTEFSYKNPTDNALQGQLKRTGVFVDSDGQVGTVQQIDLASSNPPAEPEDSGRPGE